jgi:hypothetical protein
VYGKIHCKYIRFGVLCNCGLRVKIIIRGKGDRNDIGQLKKCSFVHKR